ncbi:MTPAP [Acanthosepion pharaonis]|uniref:MTPAP n=1 Tax=Acanthosepion pharaonis TaxID=158019 RepID=A0A812DDC7_ACAPH|nr:MTPAP [Sepia pharaonis]
MAVTMLSAWCRVICLRKYFSSVSYNKKYADLTIRPNPLSLSYSRAEESFQHLCVHRKNEAKRSILIDINNKADGDFVYKHCEQFGKIKTALHFRNKKDYMLIEFENEDCVSELLSTAGHFQNDQKVPAETRLLFLTRNGNIKYKGNPEAAPVFSIEHPPLFLSDFLATDSLSSQMQLLYQHLQLTDLGQRLRFFICSTLEDMLGGLFPHCHIYPFGSSINGVGRNDCDLDMILSLCPDKYQVKKSTLKFLTKRKQEDERSFSQRNLHVFAEMIENFIPSCVGVIPILNARVPIIKFQHEACGIECDLSLQNNSGLTMSKLIYLLGVMDPQVRPLIFTVRHWAKVNFLSHKNPGPWLSNFMYSILVICFLQLRSQPILPPLKNLLLTDSRSKAQKQILFNKVGTCNVGDLLQEFLYFYSDFDFMSTALSPLHGNCFPKPDYSPLYIENPLDTELNICKNVNERELVKLCEAMKVALWQLNHSGPSLLSIFQTEDSKRILKKRFSVKDLFPKQE